ncbi:MAG: hypothetical protein KAY24_06325 [Candidatus Eisenbacteria sp.]|nr:hypothetical protein [Candidatus Eisenbacteria bacterium]
MSDDHPEWGEDKIAEELAAKFGNENDKLPGLQDEVHDVPCGSRGPESGVFCVVAEKAGHLARPSNTLL